MLKEIVVFITCPNKKEGENIGAHLVSEKLAACVNVVPGLKSIFHWDGKLNRENEVLLIIKTKLSCFNKLEKRVLRLHSYSVPEVVGLPIVKGSQKYLKWVREMTNSKKSPGRGPKKGPKK